MRNRFLSKIVTKIKYQGKGKELAQHLDKAEGVQLQFCGTEYGGFNVVPSLLKDKENAIVYSFGIGEDVSFSEAVLKNFNCSVYAYDPTPKSIKFVENHSVSSNPAFHFFPYAIAAETGTTVFHLPTNDDYVSGSLEQHSNVKADGITVETKTLRDLMAVNNHDHIDVLKIDIEGSEFSVFEKFGPEDFRFDQLCIEVHDRFFEDGLRQLENLLDSLRNNGYVNVAVSDNLEEYTFVKKDLL